MGDEETALREQRRILERMAKAPQPANLAAKLAKLASNERKRQLRPKRSLKVLMSSVSSPFLDSKLLTTLRVALALRRAILQFNQNGTSPTDVFRCLKDLWCFWTSSENCDALMGDLEEGHTIFSKNSGRHAANRWFWKQVLLTTTNLATNAVTRIFQPARKRS